MDKLKRFFRVVPRKHHVEFITALLSVPVLLTVIALNWSNLNENKKSETEKPSKIIISLPPQKNEPTQIPTKSECKDGVGTVTITEPEEGSTVSNNPLPVTIVYRPGDFCAAVWSYRINGGAWSDYDDRSLALYNLPSGSVQLELRVKSIVSGEEKLLTRNFTYKSNTPTATTMPTPTVAPSATPTTAQPLGQ